jgi:hypothetical protein
MFFEIARNNLGMVFGENIGTNGCSDGRLGRIYLFEWHIRLLQMMYAYSSLSPLRVSRNTC